jgi:hypothetical protein
MQDTDGQAGANAAQQDTAGLFVVRVSESCCEPLADRAAVQYVSPPQPLQAARSLVALMFGRGDGDGIALGEHAVAVAGGRRTITLERAR